ncbi:TetR/AcrR family transcriptional regulator [Rhodococcus kroppenstedtii]|uniref:TetR/AcrR family transcriptional regulator n=1 Tax=Rhodococcoides kroppenstedtii TaxID=293050 RepID=UPI002952ADB6|nr:TetR/AcrR family transcriptional regulator [Rhodococcus kroppenstedtii]MDV7198720.1 TetR/AcrR family transcriptional regulator [Rhodococcus kroppenstedtii]
MTTETARPKRSRAATRERVLDGALAVFAERGFGRSTPEQICERAGFTRGAFYSNFGSMDEVFLALWQRQANALVERLRAAVDDVQVTAPAGTPVDRAFTATVVDGLSGLTADVSWHVLTAEFSAYAARRLEVAAVIVEHRAALRHALLPMIVRVLAAFGREPAVDEDTLGRSVVAVYDGAMSQAMIEPDDPTPRRLALELVAAIVWDRSRPVRGQ